MFKDNLKTIRLDRKMTQRKLAAIMNVSFKTISHWESGYSEPSLEQIKKLKQNLNCDFDELLN